MRTPIEIRIGGVFGLRGPTAVPAGTPGGGGAGGGGTGPSSGASLRILPTGAPERGYRPPPYRERSPTRLEDAASAAHVQEIVERMHTILQGRLNVTLAVTLVANAAATTVIDSRISAFGGLMFCPLTANAALEMAAGTLFVSNQTSGQATITHANNAQADRNYTLVILG